MSEDVEKQLFRNSGRTAHGVVCTSFVFVHISPRHEWITKDVTTSECGYRIVNEYNINGRTWYGF